jgi:V/A-type H+-transporting ATPase subunit I
MAMLQMQRIFIYALKRDRKPILELLQRRGVLELDDTIPEDQVFRKMDVSHVRVDLEKNVHLASEALEVLSHYVPLKTSMFDSLRGRKEVSTEAYQGFYEKYKPTVHITTTIIALAKEIAELKAEILRLEAQVEILKPWTSLDIPISFEGTKHTKAFIGTLPKEMTLEGIYTELAEFTPINVDIISSAKEQTCIFILCPTEMSDTVYDKLRGMDFSLPGITSDKAPADQLTDLQQKIQEAEAAIKSAENEIIAMAQYREDIMFLCDYDRMRSDKYEVIGQLSQTENIFVISGYIPEKEVKNLSDTITKNYMVGIEVEEPSSQEDVPVILKNNGFSQPLESVVQGFSLPGSGEIDPTTVMSLFYYLLFGIMLADAGYGILMAGACGFFLLRYRKTMELSTKNFLSMFFYCGISTTFWGVMFGSYFGDLFDVIATTFFGATKVPIIPPLWFFPVNKPMQMLTFSMALGILHLLVGLIIKMYQLYKQKDYIAILYDAVSWFALILSSVVLLMSLDMIKKILGLTVGITPAIVNIASIVAILSCVIIVLTNGRESRNPLKRFLKGAYALYGITGYLSDVLSYSRLLALGLASGIIGNVINKMAAMPANMSIGPFLFAIIVVGGHTLNIAINALGAYVHTNRLQYVEFFGKFYEGGGRTFRPFAVKTKYYKVKESVKNE